VYRYFRYDGVICKSFDPFEATLTFAKGIPMNRVEILGPQHHTLNPRECADMTYFMKRQKINVKVEGTEDGEKWQSLGEVKGVSAQADFQPISFPARTLKGLRFRADTSGYKWNYKMDGKNGFFSVTGNSPHFGWRLFGPGKESQ